MKSLVVELGKRLQPLSAVGSECINVQRCQTVCQLCRLGSWLGRKSVCVCVCKVQTLSPSCFKVGFWMRFRCVMGPRRQGQTGSITSPNLTLILRPKPAGFTVHQSGSFHKQLTANAQLLHTHSLGSRMKVGQSSSENAHKQTQGKDTHTHHTSLKQKHRSRDERTFCTVVFLIYKAQIKCNKI